MGRLHIFGERPLAQLQQPAGAAATNNIKTTISF
jgi:hypothetical protein